ncbi:hypothetical protein EV663_11115 [Rhodovulum bhavnagarense]|uniref:Glycosyltransferase involved in cell wall biosynthesis n=1 Tax=Rhodovulum bhavnagarense TaxID=992286 RepID=A0A4R2RDG6_9RHOB|nr:glycosyl transferase family 1 [Rhodovulum bhavnagarense]TCP60229.1 hypothetical protein EV663_11115 [Rhodovulum bhavnagarense]
MSSPAPLIFVVMAVFRPDPAQLRAQIGSLAGQTHRNHRLVAVIADTESGALLRDTAGEAGLADPVIVTPDVALDAVRAFELGIAEALTQIDMLSPAVRDTALIALSDQDDIWHPDRLAHGVEALAGTDLQLVHSDARLVAGDGITEIHPSMFAYERRLPAPGARGLLYRNTITGMTVLMRAGLARLALPFPAQAGVHFYHDLWLGLLAEATGGVGRIDAALVDYRQHDRNAIGAVDRQAGWLKGVFRLRRRLPGKMWLRREAASYALARYLAHSAHNRLIEAVHDNRLPDGGLNTTPLRPFLRRLRGSGAHFWDAGRYLMTGHAGLARIATGFAVVGTGRVAWALREALGPHLGEALEAFDTRLYSLSPGMPPRAAQVPDTLRERHKRHRPRDWTEISDERKTPRWSPEFSAPDPGLVILVPTLNPTEIFAGIDTALDFAVGLAARGIVVRLVATDLPVSSPGASRQFILRRMDRNAAMAGTAGRVRVHCGVSSQTLPMHRGDIFMATAWWTAHVAEKLIRRHGFFHPRFHYLIQDYEPNFYAWGPEFADAMASYAFDLEAIFNTSLLRAYFAAQGFGFAGPDAPAFRPAIDIARYAAGTRPPRPASQPRRLALYGRPAVARNMFATAVEALGRFVVAENLAPGDIEIVSVGMPHDPVKLPNGVVMESLGKLALEDYPGFLLETDIGLSLMYSPHPSHPPIEMAASGCRVVTNAFPSKDLGLLTPAIESTEPTATALGEALSRAWRAGPVSAQDRQIDLSRLGATKDDTIDRLAERLRPALANGKAPTP